MLIAVLTINVLYYLLLMSAQCRSLSLAAAVLVSSSSARSVVYLSSVLSMSSSCLLSGSDASLRSAFDTTSLSDSCMPVSSTSMHDYTHTHRSVINRQTDRQTCSNERRVCAVPSTPRHSVTPACRSPTQPCTTTHTHTHTPLCDEQTDRETDV